MDGMDGWTEKRCDGEIERHREERRREAPLFSPSSKGAVTSSLKRATTTPYRRFSAVRAPTWWWAGGICRGVGVKGRGWECGLVVGSGPCGSGRAQYHRAGHESGASQTAPTSFTPGRRGRGPRRGRGGRRPRVETRARSRIGGGTTRTSSNETPGGRLATRRRRPTLVQSGYEVGGKMRCWK